MTNDTHAHNFLSGGGEMGQRMREYDWDNSSLGNPSDWPLGLKTAIRLLLSSAHPMFIWWGPEFIQFYNDKYRPSIGWDRHPSALGQKGKTCWEEIWPIIIPGIEKVMRGDGSVWAEDQLVPITRDEKLEDAYWTYSYDPIYEETAPNEVGGVLVILTETTQNVMEKKRHQEAEARWKELFASAPAFMCVYKGSNHIYEYANARYYDLIGHRELINRSLEEVAPEVYEQGFGDLLDYIYATGQSHVGLATPVTFKDSDDIERNLFLDFVLQPIINAEGKVTGIFANGYDVTDRVVLQRSLEEQDRRKDEFLAMLAHELRNPLAPIRNASELLTQTTQYGSMSHSLGDLIKRQVVQLTRLIDDLLEVSRISQGRMELQMGPVVLDQAIKFAVESTAASVLDKKIRLVYDCDESLLLINGDFARIAQSLINLIVNATKYTEEGGKININLYLDIDHAVIDISDTGIGVEAHMLDKIFDLFMQVDNSIDRSQGGLGIGLSVVKTIIQMHGGTIAAKSPGLGQGATFSLRIPIMPYQESGLIPHTATTLAPMKLLLIDDNEDATNSLAMLLNTVGHNTTVTYRGTDALEVLKSQTFDAILLDIGLPDIDGYKVAETIRANNKNIIIVAISGYGQTEDIRKALAAGFSGHLTKPVSLDALEKKLSGLIAQKNNLTSQENSK